MCLLYFGHGSLTFHGDRCDSLLVRVSASSAGDRGFDVQLLQTKVFKTGSSGFPPWRSGLWE